MATMRVQNTHRYTCLLSPCPATLALLAMKVSREGRGGKIYYVHKAGQFTTCFVSGRVRPFLPLCLPFTFFFTQVSTRHRLQVKWERFFCQ